MPEVFLLLGTNQGERESNLAVAVALIGKEIGNISKTSSLYRTAAWGKTDQPEFINQVILVTTALPPELVLERILSIESRMGRQRTEKWAERMIDIDILLYGSLIMDTETLLIPHPQLPFRRFTLVPLAEIAGSLHHPVLKKSIQQLLTECEDALAVTKL